VKKLARKTPLGQGLGVIALKLPVMIFAALASKIFQRRDVDAYRHA